MRGDVCSAFHENEEIGLRVGTPALHGSTWRSRWIEARGSVDLGYPSQSDQIRPHLREFEDARLTSAATWSERQSRLIKVNPGCSYFTGFTFT